MADALLHSCAVYFYAYDPQTRAYTQQSDSAVGCALLAGASETDADADTASSSSSQTTTASPFKLLFYNNQKQPLLTLPVTATAPTCTPQQDNYVNFLDDVTQTFYSLRFKDTAGVRAFLSAVAFAKAQALVTTAASTQQQQLTVVVDDIAPLTGDTTSAAGLAVGDTAGVTLTLWTGRLEPTAIRAFFTANPLDIATQPTIEQTNDIERIRLVDQNANSPNSSDVRALLLHALATYALAGMHKHATRLVALVSSTEWLIATVDLVKIKSASRTKVSHVHTETKSNLSTDTTTNDDLVQRMALLSRAGSKGSGLIASLSARQLSNGNDDSSSATSSRHASQTAPIGHSATFAELQAAVAQSFVPQQQQQRLNETTQQPAAAPSVAIDAVTTAESVASAPLIAQSPSSLASKVFANTRAPISAKERLMQEQTELLHLQQQLEANKRRLQHQNDENDDSTSTNNNTTTTRMRTTLAGRWSPPADLDFTRGSSLQAPLPSSVFTPSSAYQPPPLPIGNSSSSASLFPPFQPSLSSLSSLSSSPFPSSNQLALPNSHNLSSYDSNFSRLERSTATIESTLTDVDAKLDRLLNVQQQQQRPFYATNNSNSTGSLAARFAAPSASSTLSLSASSTSTAQMLKTIEKALTQRDQLLQETSQLQATHTEMVDTIEHLEQLVTNLQHENQNLMQKRQTNQQLQTDSLRTELNRQETHVRHAQVQLQAQQEEIATLRQDNQTKDLEVQQLKEQLQHERQQQRDAFVTHQQTHQQTQALETALQEIATQKARVEELEVQQMQLQQMQQTLTHALQTMTTERDAARREVVGLKDAAVRSQELEKTLEQLEARVADSEKVRFECEQLVATKQQALDVLEAQQIGRNDLNADAMHELLKTFMNELYFHFQDAFEHESAEFTSREIVLAIRKILKQRTIEILQRVDALAHEQSQQ